MRRTATTLFGNVPAREHPMGEIFGTSETPTLTMTVHGTAPISRVTLVRNENDYQIYTPASKSNDFSETFVDEQPLEGENRYYLRVEQADGNMGWTSPVWVDVK